MCLQCMNINSTFYVAICIAINRDTVYMVHLVVILILWLVNFSISKFNICQHYLCSDLLWILVKLSTFNITLLPICNVLQLLVDHRHRNQGVGGHGPPRFCNFSIGNRFFAMQHNPVKPLCPPGLSAFLCSCSRQT